jgi:hypothetical protein
MSIVLPFAEKFVVEEVSGDMLFPRGFATAGTCTYSRKSSRFYLGVMEPSRRISQQMVILSTSFVYFLKFSNSSVSKRLSFVW